MKGKELKVSELNKTIDTKEHKLEVYAVFRDVKYGNTYAIYKDTFELTNDILHYASSHFKENTLVLLNIKNSDYVEELIKEFTWDLLNGKENDKFEILDISNIERAEVISSNTLKVKNEVLVTLKEKNIPKSKKELEAMIPKPMSSARKVLVPGFTLAFLVVVAFFIVNRDIFEPITYTLRCTKTETDDRLNATIDTTDDLIFNKENNLLLKRNITMVYTFNTKEDYEEYNSLGLYYKIEPIVNSATMTYNGDDTNNIFTITENMTTEKEYFEPTKYDEVVERMEYYSYTCSKVEEDK